MKVKRTYEVSEIHKRVRNAGGKRKTHYDVVMVDSRTGQAIEINRVSQLRGLKAPTLTEAGSKVSVTAEWE